MVERKNRAFFTTEDDGGKKKFINSILHYTRIVKDGLLNLKRFSNSLLEKSKRSVARVNYKKVFTDLAIWFIETTLEGLTANFATHQLFHLEFNLQMILAHGILINQTLSIIKRIVEIKNGSNNELPAEEHPDEE